MTIRARPGTSARARAKPDWMSPRMAWRAIQAALPREAIISSDIGNNCAIGNAYPTFEEGRKYLAPGLFGPCGYGLPSIIGAKIGCPDVPVVGFAGDGAFGIAVTEMTAIGREEWPAITMVIFRNYQWGAEKRNSTLWYDDNFVGTELNDRVSYAGIAQACGLKGVQVADDGGADRGAAQGDRRPDGGQDHLDRGAAQPGTGRAVPPRRDEDAGRGGGDRPGGHGCSGRGVSLPFDLGPWAALWMAVAIFGAAFVRGYSGLRVGGADHRLVVLVTNPLNFVAVVTFLDFLMTFQQWRGVRGHVDWGRITPLMLGAFAGVPLGLWLLTGIGVDAARVVISVYVLVMCAILLRGWTMAHSAGRAAHAVTGLVSGMANAAGAGGLPVAVFFAVAAHCGGGVPGHVDRLFRGPRPVDGPVAVVAWADHAGQSCGHGNGAAFDDAGHLAGRAAFLQGRTARVSPLRDPAPGLPRRARSDQDAALTAIPQEHSTACVANGKPFRRFGLVRNIRPRHTPPDRPISASLM